jgi:uncharacterized protein (TIRG00374 family)
LTILRHWRIGLVGIVASAIATYFILTEIDTNTLADALETAKFSWVIPCIILLLLGLVTRAMRWRVLLSNGLPFWRAFNIMNVAYLVNSILPLRIGEVARAYLATRLETPIPVFKTISAVILERILDLLAVVILVAIALVFGPVPNRLQTAGISFGILGFSGFFFLVFLSNQRELSHRVFTLVLERFEPLEKFNLAPRLDHFLDGLSPLTQIHTLALALGWTALSWGLSVAAGYILMFTFYDDASIAVTCLYIAAAAFAIAVPAVPGNLGTYEGSILLALSALNFDEPFSRAAAFAVTVHLVNLVVHAMTGIFGLIEEGVSLQQLTQNVSRVTETDLQPNEASEGV